MAVLDKAGLTYFWEKLKAILSGKAPTSHASAATTYGIGSASNYGHVKAYGSPGAGSSDNPSAGTDNGLYARGNHSHPHASRIQSATADSTLQLILYDSGARLSVAEASPLGTSGYRFTTIYLASNPNVSSDRRGKKDIEEVSKAMDLIMALRPVQYHRVKGDDRLYFGLIAQEVRDALEALGIEDSDLLRRDSIDEDIPVDEATEDQVRYSLAYSELISPLIAVVQEQHRRIEALEAANGSKGDV